MTRATATTLGTQAFGQYMTQNVLDPTYGGQNGWANDYTQWLNNHAYISRQIVPVVMQAPGFFQYMQDPLKWVQILRAFFETHARSIEGLNSGLEWEFEDHPVGGAGEVQSEVANARRQVSEPTVGVIEKDGLPFQNFLKFWGQYGMMDPDTKYALASNLSDDDDTIWTPDKYTATVMFFEPDARHRRVTKAWLCTNMMPRSSGEETGRRDLTAGGELLTLSIQFTALTQTGVGVRALAQSLLDAMNVSNPNPYLRAAFLDSIDSDVAAATDSYATTIQTVADQAVTDSVAP